MSKQEIIIEDTNKLIVLIILDSRASLWKGQLLIQTRYYPKQKQVLETVFKTTTELVHSEEK